MSKEVLGEFAPQGVPVNQVNYTELDNFNDLNRLERHLDTTIKVGNTALRAGKKAAVPVGITAISALTLTHPVEAKEIAESVENSSIENEELLRVGIGIVTGIAAGINEAKESANIRNWGQIGLKLVAGYVFGYHLVELGQESMETNPDNWKRGKDVATMATSVAYITKTTDFTVLLKKTAGKIAEKRKTRDAEEYFFRLLKQTESLNLNEQRDARNELNQIGYGPNKIRETKYHLKQKRRW